MDRDMRKAIYAVLVKQAEDRKNANRNRRGRRA
jgi:hypothetical protein